MNNKTNLVLIVGKTATGKTASLRNIPKQEELAYLNCESGKEPPFQNKFKKIIVTDPRQVIEAITQAEKAKIHTIVVDSLTYMMDLFELRYIIPAPDSRKAWGLYWEFFKELMGVHVAKSTKNIVFLAHTSDIYNEQEQVMETMVKVKGSLMNQGVESYFTNVIACKKMSVVKLENYLNPLLTITEEDKALGFKHVFQTRLTKDTVNERIRGPFLPEMWTPAETFINNDIQIVLDKLHKYYK